MERRRLLGDPETARLLEGWLSEPWTPRRNCWHLAATVSRELYGRDVPLQPFRGALPAPAERPALFAAHPERARWRPVAGPEDGALVLMSRGGAGDQHAGIVVALGRPRILHRDQPHGTVFETPEAVATLRRWRLSYFVPASEA